MDREKNMNESRIAELKQEKIKLEEQLDRITEELDRLDVQAYICPFCGNYDASNHRKKYENNLVRIDQWRFKCSKCGKEIECDSVCNERCKKENDRDPNGGTVFARYQVGDEGYECLRCHEGFS